MKKRVKIIRKDKIKLFRHGFKFMYTYQTVFNGIGQVICVNTFIPSVKTNSRYFSAGS